MTGMKLLLDMDQKNYSDDMPVQERWCVRGVIAREGRIAVQRTRRGEYKLLGGGMEKEEDIAEALAREVEEESGLLIRKDTIRPLGEIREKRRDIYDSGLVYYCHTLYFACEVETATGRIDMTDSEIEAGCHLEWATPSEIISGNGDFLYLPWILRDSRFVQLCLTDFG